MAKKKKKQKHSFLSVLVTILTILFIAVWGLVACQKGVSLYKDILADKEKSSEQPVVAQEVEPTTSQEEIVASENDEQEVTQVEIATEEIVKEEPTTEEQPTQEIGQGSDGLVEFDGTGDPSTLSNESYSWSFKRNSDHSPVTGYSQGIDLSSYGAYYKVDTEEKVIYLTFDEGYENGHTAEILDILKANDVQAAFFVTKPYITSNPDLCTRIKDEGHVVGNHSVTHSKFSTLSEDEIEQELVVTQQTFEEVTGYEMDLFFRPPAGEYSERALFDIIKTNYRTIFWSLAYQDWDVNNQPGKEAAYKHVMDNHHPGGIFLLHAVSKSNTEALDDILKALKAEGYRFGSLYEVE